MSTREKRQRAAKSKAKLVVDESGDEAKSTPIATSKRKRVANLKAHDAQASRPAKRKRGNRGVLEKLLDMPMDVVIEIFGQLDPADLMHLSRTSKDLRAVLLNRSSAFIWREALANYVPRLPECPSDINEPTYVVLAFGKQCHACGGGRSGNQVTFWAIRRRLCTQCARKEFTLKYDNGCYGAPKWTIPSARSRRNWEVLYHTETVRKLRTAAMDRKDFDLKSEHAEKCEAWQKAYDRVLADQQAQVEAAKKKQIASKLRDCGVAEDSITSCFSEERFWKHQVISSLMKKDITERVWDNAQESVIDAVKLANKRIARDAHWDNVKLRHKLIRKLHDDYVKSCPVTEIAIPAADLFATAEVTSLLQATPLATEMTLEDFADIKKALPQLSASWRAATRQKLFEMARTSCSEGLNLTELSEVTDAILDLAVVAFNCRDCSQTLDAQQALVHPCAVKLNVTVKDMSSWPERSTSSCFELYGFVINEELTPWNRLGVITFSMDMSRVVKALDSLGYDVKTTKVAEMDEKDEIFECKGLTSDCHSLEDGRLMLDWRAMIRHAATCAYLQLVRVDETTASIIRGRMDEKFVVGTESCYQRVPLVCAHCKADFMNKGSREIRNHLLDKHGIEPEDASDKDVFLPLRVRPRRPYRYLKLSRATLF